MKSQDTSSPADQVTPPPIEDDGGRLGQVPISVADGDFSTPTRRKRTVTQPRGLKTLESPPVVVSDVTPPPPVPVIEAAAPTPEPPPPPPVVSAPTIEPGASPVDEFLAAPPTPAPEAGSTPPPVVDPTPPPVSAAIENLDQAAEMRRAAFAEAERVATANQALAGESTDPGGVLDQSTAPLPIPPEPALHQPEPDGVLSTVPIEEIQLAVDVTLEARAEADVDGIALDGEVVAGHDVSVDDLASVGSGPVTEASLSPLAQTLAHMAEALQSDVAVNPAGDIDIVDAPLVPGARGTPPPEPIKYDTRTPPPIPLAGAARAVVRPDAPLAVEPPPAEVPEALAERPRRPRRSKPWYEEVFDEDYLRTLPFMTPEQTLREVDFIEASLGVAKGGEVLDVACGYGRHAIELVQRGLTVTGLDLSLPLLIRAADESQRRALSVNFVHSDMREVSFGRQFDGAYCMLTSFGYFDEESNLKVAEGIARCLKPGGRFLLDVINRDYVIGDLPARIWWEGDGCVVLEEVDFNFNTNRILTHRSVVFEDGRQVEHEISVRAYSLHELGKVLRQAGFRVIEVSGNICTRGHFFGATSRNLLVLVERRSD